MDPISIITLAASTTQAAYTVSTQIYLFVNAVKNVDETVKGLSGELSGLRRSLDATSVTLQNPLVRSDKAAAVQNAPIWAAVAGALDDCRQTLQRFEKQVAPHQTRSSRRGIFKRSVSTWKLNLSSGEIASTRDQIHSHTGSLQVALQTLNILVSGLAPANAFKDIGQGIAQLTEALNRLSTDDPRKTSSHHAEVESAARAVLSDAADVVSTGLLVSSSREAQTAASASLKAVIKRFDASIYDGTLNSDAGDSAAYEETAKARTDFNNDYDQDSSDSEADLELSLVTDLLDRGAKAFYGDNYREAEDYLRDAFGHVADTAGLGQHFDADAARYDLALCCLYQGKVEEAELILLLLTRDQDQITRQTLRASHTLATVYLCLFEFDAALLYCKLALKGRKRLFGKRNARYWSSMQLLSLLYRANGDFVSSAAYFGDLENNKPVSNENAYILSIFSGYSAASHARLSLHEKRQALNELAGEDLIPSQRNPTPQPGDTSTPLRVISHPPLASLDLTSALIASVHKDKVLSVRFLLSRGADPNGGLATNPLIAAAHAGYTDITRLLLDAGADANKCDDGQRTPLYWASLWGHEATVRVILQYHANIHKSDRDLETPLIAAATKGQTLVIPLLLRAGARLDSKTERGNMALHAALRSNHLDAARALVDAGADVNAPDSDGKSPLHLAVGLRSEALASLLLRKGAQVDARDRGSCTALLVMPSNSARGTIDVLIKAGADVNAVDSKGETAATKACDWDVAELLLMLISNGADVNAGSPKNRAGVRAKQRGSRRCLLVLSKLSDVIYEDDRPKSALYE